MFSLIFPGQGSQAVGMGKELYNKFDLVRKLFQEADETLNFSLSKLIFNGLKCKCLINCMLSSLCSGNLFKTVSCFQIIKSDWVKVLFL